MNSTLAPGTTIKPSKIDGKGCFATVHFRKGHKIAEYLGEKISRCEISRRVKGKRRLYISGLDSYWAIDASRLGNGTQYINHSCEPNCYVKVIHGHMLFFALRNIEPGEEILLDYEESYHTNGKRCACRAASCRGRINKREGIRNKRK